MLRNQEKNKIADILEYTLKQQWRWAGHTARMKDNRWTKRRAEWQPKEREETTRTTMQKMARRHKKEGGNHLEQESNRQRATKGIEEGLHPAVEGQSLGEGEGEDTKLFSVIQGIKHTDQIS